MTVPVVLNGRWTLNLPEHRVDQWADAWELERIESMWSTLVALATDYELVRGEPGYRPVVFDLGAEEGDLPALWASWGCDVVCVEPQAKIWPNIRACFEANDLLGAFRAGVVGFAGAELGGVVNVYNDGEWPPESVGPVVPFPGFCHLDEAGDVLPVVTVDALTAACGPPDAITVDVEGSEIRVIEGAERTLVEHRPYVWVSVHPEFMFHRHGIYEQEFHSALHRHGYEKAHLAFDHEHHWAYWPSEKRPSV